MQLTITINPGNIGEVRQGITLLNGFLKDAGLTPVETPVLGTDAPVAGTAAKSEKAAREKKPAQHAEQPKEPAPSSAGESSATTASAGTGASDESAPVATLAQLSEAVIAVGKAGKRSDLVEYLDKFNVKKASELPVEKWNDVIAKCNEILSEV